MRPKRYKVGLQFNLDVMYLFERPVFFKALYEGRKEFENGVPAYFNYIERTLGKNQVNVLEEKGIIEVHDGILRLTDWGRFQLELCVRLARGIIYENYPTFMNKDERQKLCEYVLKQLGLENVL
jgi:hypothetical protein